MRVMIATAATITLAAATAAAMALHSPPARQTHGAPAAIKVADMAPADAVPGLVWHSGSATLRLTDRPCASDELANQLDGEGVMKALAYEVTQGSRHYSGCWTKDVSGDVVTAEPGRDIGSIPVAWFRPGT
jgi:hypothetical protein